MTPELRLLASSVYFVAEKSSVQKISSSGNYSGAAKKWLLDDCSHREKAPQVRGYFFYIGHTGTPTKAKLNVQADKSKLNYLRWRFGMDPH